MRLDYTLYALGALLLFITIVPLVITIEGVESEARTLWMVSTVVLGLLSISLGYSQRPKTTAQACQPVTAVPQEAVPVQTQEATPQTQPAPTIETSTTAALELKQVKGIGEKRTAQLKALGISNVEDLAKASAEDIAEKLQISSKITKKWVANAKEL